MVTPIQTTIAQAEQGKEFLQSEIQRLQTNISEIDDQRDIKRAAGHTKDVAQLGIQRNALNAGLQQARELLRQSDKYVITQLGASKSISLAQQQKSTQEVATAFQAKQERRLTQIERGEVEVFTKLPPNIQQRVLSQLSQQEGEMVTFKEGVGFVVAPTQPSPTQPSLQQIFEQRFGRQPFQEEIEQYQQRYGVSVPPPKPTVWQRIKQIVLPPGKPPTPQQIQQLQATAVLPGATYTERMRQITEERLRQKQLQQYAGPYAPPEGYVPPEISTKGYEFEEGVPFEYLAEKYREAVELAGEEIGKLPLGVIKIPEKEYPAPVYKETISTWGAPSITVPEREIEIGPSIGKAATFAGEVGGYAIPGFGYYYAASDIVSGAKDLAAQPSKLMIAETRPIGISDKDWNKYLEEVDAYNLATQEYDTSRKWSGALGIGVGATVLGAKFIRRAKISDIKAQIEKAKPTINLAGASTRNKVVNKLANELYDNVKLTSEQSSALRVYVAKIKVDGKTYNNYFIETSKLKGIAPKIQQQIENLFGRRTLYGMTIDAQGKVVSQVAGVSLEKAGVTSTELITKILSVQKQGSVLKRTYEKIFGTRPKVYAETITEIGEPIIERGWLKSAAVGEVKYVGPSARMRFPKTIEAARRMDWYTPRELAMWGLGKPTATGIPLGKAQIGRFWRPTKVEVKVSKDVFGTKIISRDVRGIEFAAARFIPEGAVKITKIKKPFDFKAVFGKAKPTIEPSIKYPKPKPILKPSEPGRIRDISLYRGLGLYERTPGATLGVVSKEMTFMGIPKPTAFAPTISIGKPRVDFGLVKPRLEITTIPRPAIEVITKPKVVTILKPLVRIKPIIQPAQEFIPRLKPAQLIKPAQRIEVIPKPAIRPRLVPRTIPRRMVTPTIIPKPGRLLVPPPPLKTKPPKRIIKAPLALAPAFIPFVKRKGVFVAVGKPTTKARALAIGERITRRTAAVTFTARPTKFFVKPSKRKYVPKPLEFRAYKIVKGKRVALKDTFIQRRRIRIKTPGELREITLKGIRARKEFKIL